MDTIYERRFLMKRRYGKSVWMIVLLIELTGFAIVYARIRPGSDADDLHTVSVNNSGVTASATLTQSKVLQGSDGKLTMSLDISAEDGVVPDQGRQRNVDMVMVMDRSGSMQGRKLAYARQGQCLIFRPDCQLKTVSLWCPIRTVSRSTRT